LFVALTVILGLGCADAFNPSFLNLFDASGSNDQVAFQAVTEPIGHVPIVFLNSARISDRVFRFIIEGQPVVQQEVVDEIHRVNPQVSEETIAEIVQDIIDGEPTNLEILNLPPRVRLTVDVTLVSGGVQQLEFLSGLRLVRGEGQFGGSVSEASLPPDLTENDADVFIPQCEIAQLEIVSVDVFIPVTVRLLQTVCFDNAFGGTTCNVVCQLQEPQFDGLEPDEGFSEQEGTFTTLRNYDPRFFPPPLTTVQCGTVVTIELDGNLTLPFRPIPPDCPISPNPPDDGLAPGYFSDDVFDLTEGLQVPGRYGVSLSVRGLQ
jgi:hypothetical protein